MTGSDDREANILQNLQQFAFENNLLNIALENMSDGLSMYDGQQRLILANSLYADIYDIPREELIPGRKLQEIVRIAGVYCGNSLDDFVTQVEDWAVDLNRTEMIRELSNGRTVHLKRQLLADGGWLSTHTDITDRKRIETQFEESENRFMDIAELASDWFWETDENHRFTFLSDRFEQATGVNPENILGKTRIEFARGTGPMWEKHQADLDAASPFRDLKYSTTDKKGQLRYWSISGKPIFDKNGVFKGYRGSGSNRTLEETARLEILQSRDRLQEEVERATANLRSKAAQLEKALAKEKELAEVQRQFVAMASHEFRTPLTIISNSIQHLERQRSALEPDYLLSKTAKIRNAVDRMGRLMESTLSLARMDDGAISVEIGDCEIGQLVDVVCACHQDIAKNHNLTCQLKNLPSTIRADARAVEQIISNLLSNAVKYAPDAPDIAVTAVGVGDHVEITVRDQGLGIDEEDLPNLFKRFFRAGTSTGIVGTGIGLHLVKALVELHGGTIAAANKKGEGSLFKVRLPVEGPDENDRAAGQAA